MVQSLDLVDVFGRVAFAGNPLGVVRGGAGLTSEQMLKLTQWLGFSETTFLLPPSDPAADYRLRIFYPAGELPFAGHPTLGSCHAWLAAGGRPKRTGVVVQECGAGLIEIRQDGEEMAFAAPPLTRSGPLSETERAEAIRLAGVDPAAVVEAVHIANGPKWQLLRLRSAQDVLAANPVSRAPIGTDVGLAGPHSPGGDADWEIRAFFANQRGQLTEDPVTGSFNAGVAVHFFASGLASESYRAAQGQCVGADGRISCTKAPDGRIWIGGRCDTIAQGASLPALG
ncbi:MAG: phenazine biosynthesis protein PhzF [Erythrobacter sp.]|nr:phenazine biosynthesis protein PhzF [Erythrobacter sp.]